MTIFKKLFVPNRNGHLILNWAISIMLLESHTLAMAQEVPTDPAGQAKALSRAFRNAAKVASPSVVTVISSMTVDRNDLKRIPGLLPEGFELPEGIQLPESRSVGSGIIIDEEGTILTNSHVVIDADEIIVRLSDGREVKPTEIKSDSKSDLAILRIPAQPELQIARLGDSDQLAIGDWVIAIGSPFELDTTVSAGIISGKGRGISQIKRGRLLQTDAAINPGNSGGPLVNIDGEVVGINTAIASSSGGYQGIGFAIPVNRAKWIAQQLKRDGVVKRAFLGIKIQEVTPSVAQRLKIRVRAGVLVDGVTSSSPAETAGVKKDDVIVEFAGQSVRVPGELQDIVEQQPVGSTRSVVLMRNGEKLTLEVVLQPLPDQI